MEVLYFHISTFGCLSNSESEKCSIAKYIWNLAVRCIHYNNKKYLHCFYWVLQNNITINLTQTASKVLEHTDSINKSLIHISYLAPGVAHLKQLVYKLRLTGHISLQLLYVQAHAALLRKLTLCNTLAPLVLQLATFLIRKLYINSLEAYLHYTQKVTT